VLSAFVGVRTLQNRIVAEAQNSVRLNIHAAWAELENRIGGVGIVLGLVANKELVVQVCESKAWTDEHLRSRLDGIRARQRLDFLDLLGPDGSVKVRTTPPYTTGDFRISDPAVASAMKGEPKVCFSILSASELEKEADGLTERAFLELEDTPRARLTEKKTESRGMAIVGAVPVRSGSAIVGVVYGGVLINRNHELVDRIRDVLYGKEEYKGVPRGTATIFLNDVRIATTVRRENGNRALGTRVSKEVADRVLDTGEPWVGDAFVVRDWYLTAYEPIRDGLDNVVGMLYVGILKRPFLDEGRAIILRYLYLSLFVLTVALVLAFIIASRLAQPIHGLVEASHRTSRGDRPSPVLTKGTCRETQELVEAFNAMTSALAEREEKLKALNRSYMETLGFVAHELKSPVATIMNYVYLMREQKLGPLTEKQGKAMKAIDDGGNHLVEMVRHYLNLSRIENGELSPSRRRVAVLEEVLQPLLDGLEAPVQERRMRVENSVGRDVAVEVDPGMLREVFENLVSNAVKYGREDGTIWIRSRSEGHMAEFAVRNEGDGIPEEKRGLLFQKFSRLEDKRTPKLHKGTGLGLFITKHIVESHGGQVAVDSKTGEWVEFRFTLPLAATAS
jgi:two-component system NtrC family sensor kinase